MRLDLFQFMAWFRFIFDLAYLICINVVKHPEINVIDIRTTLVNSAAFDFGNRPLVGKLFGNEITNRADADKI